MSLTLPRKKFNLEEYYQIMNAGVLAEDTSTELIRGEIFEMSPIGFRQASCVNKLNRIFSRELGNYGIVSVQNPIELSNNSQPQPDLVLLKPRDDFYSTRHPLPDDILLLIEVADSSIEYNRSLKLPLYAESKISLVWLIDLNQNYLEVYSHPQENYYQNRQKLSVNNTVTLINPCEIEIPLNQLF